MGETVEKKPDAWRVTIQQIFSQIASFLKFIFGFGLTKEIQNGNVVGSGNIKLKSVKQIPGPTPLPIFGTTITSIELKMTNLLKANELRFKKFGPIVKEEHLWGFPMIHILDTDYIEQAMTVMGDLRPGMEILDYYRKRRTDRYDSVGLTNSLGEEWKRLHSVISPIITSPKFIRSLSNASDEMSREFVMLLNESGPRIDDVQGLLRKFVTETSFFNVFGKRMGFMFPDEKMPQQLKMFLHAHDRLWAALHETSYGFPWWKYFATKLWYRNTENEDSLIDIMEDMIQTALKEDSAHGEGMLGTLLDSKELSYKTKRLLTLEVIMGSSDSVISTITFMLYFICRDKRVASKLFEELKTLFPSKDSELVEDTVLTLPYLKACITECYRICCIAPNIMRLTDESLELGGYFIPAYSLIVIQWGYAAMQEKSFYKPTEFIPERWIYEKGQKSPFHPHRRNSVHQFGLGARSCPGRRLVNLHVPILLARILRSFEVTVHSEFEPKYEWLVQPAHPMSMTFRERSDEE